MTRRRVVLAAIAAVVVAGLIVSGATGVLQAGARLGIHAIRGPGSGAAPTQSPHPTTSAGRTPSARQTATTRSTPKARSSLDPVLRPAEPKRADAKKLKARIKKTSKPKHAGTTGVAVLDGASGKTLYSRRAGKPMAPASTNKLVTSAAALQQLGGQHRFRTKVVGTKSGNIILVGGGDPYLTSKSSKKDPERGSLQRLAKATAKKLRSRGTKKLRLGYDASLFSGSGWNSHWRTSYRNQVTPISALWADEGRIGDGSPGPRQRHPAKSAASTFANQLKKYGVKTSAVAKAHASRDDDRIAAVESMPLSVIIQRLLRQSDNDAAEVVARQVAIAADKPASFAGAASAIKDTLTKADVWQSGTRTYDGSGLSRDDRVPAAMFAAILRRAIDGDRSQWRPLLAGLPVAGVEGTLGRHYTSSHNRAGRGLVRAKTGTLRGIHSLAGYAHTRDGELLIFALLTNHSKQDYTTPIWLRRLSTAIASCGCRR